MEPLYHLYPNCCYSYVFCIDLIETARLDAWETSVARKQNLEDRSQLGGPSIWKVQWLTNKRGEFISKNGDLSNKKW